MRILVTGGAGYIGSHVALRLVEAGHDVTVLDNLSTGHRWAVPSECTFVEGSTGDEVCLERLFDSRAAFDAVMHFAANTDVGESVLNPAKYYENNTVNTIHVISAALKAGVKSFIFSSTAAVYGEQNAGIVDEQAQTSPSSPYGHSKLMCEHALQDFAVASGDQMSYVILRYFNVAGARPDARIGQATPNATHLIKVAAEAAVGRRTGVSVFGTDYDTKDGTCLRDFIHVEDLATAHLCALSYLADGGRSDIFNVGYGVPYSVRDVIRSMKQVSGSNFEVIEAARRAGDISSLAADSRKIQTVLGWRPEFNNLNTICDTAYRWEKRLLNGDVAPSAPV